jgi:hypothetical protein
MSMNKRLFSLPAIALVVFAFCMALALHRSFVKERENAERNGCIGNMIAIDGAKEQWARETGATNGSPVDTNAVMKYFKGGYIACPTTQTNSYEFGSVGEKPRCLVHGISPCG